MRFTLSSTALSSKLNALSKVINSKNALPILGDFVFETTKIKGKKTALLPLERFIFAVQNETDKNKKTYEQNRTFKREYFK